MSERREAGIEPRANQSLARGPQTSPGSERGPSGPAVTAESGQV
jgi:hypothetical protein